MSTHGVFFMSLLIAEATIRAEAMTLVTIQPQISRRYTVVTTYLTPGISNRVSAILRWSSCMHKWWGNQQDCSFSKFKPLDTLSGGSKVHTLQKTGPSYAKQCTLGKVYLRSNLSRKIQVQLCRFMTEKKQQVLLKVNSGLAACCAQAACWCT